MRIVDLENGELSLDEIMVLVENQAVVLRKPDGAMYALAPVDDFDVEVELLKKNTEFMSFLKELSQEKATISLKSLRNELGL
ncbi:MAG: hypothetical protein KME35_15960 [Aphanocapsa sp. GSE-SYN-MK-11-07L]|jgi:hypothetical protein|nr:hypothetical protein [Aphanocapsa sp. GSE-SYN-MK-11-07L]